MLGICKIVDVNLKIEEDKFLLIREENSQESVLQSNNPRGKSACVEHHPHKWNTKDTRMSRLGIDGGY